jgi:CMP/dCMP kinase
MSKITIAIDGYSSCGKSTLARALAARLNYAYVDSGAMYRCITLYCLKKGIIKDHSFLKDEVVKTLPEIKLSFHYNPKQGINETWLNDQNVEKEIRSMEVAAHVSAISAIKEVRAHMVEIQREMGKNKGVVMDGRDIGTTVFPDAELKVFMTADMDVRVQRRYDEIMSKGGHVTFDEVKTNLFERDHQDTHRKESPLKKANDAIVLDNTDLDKEQQLEFVLRLINDLMLTKDSFVD